MIANTLPPGLQDNPRLEQWIGFETKGRVRIATGKVELGQGIATAVVQIAADELDVDMSQIDHIAGNTDRSPNEGFTAGSLSVENSGGSVRLVAAEVRALMCAAAAVRLECAIGSLTVSHGAIFRDGVATGLDYWKLAGSIDLTAKATGIARLKTATERRLIGRSLSRVDLAAKVTGAAQCFIHDFLPPDVRHARILRQPWPEAQLQGPSDAAMRALLSPSDQLIRVNAFLAVVSDSERAAVVAAEKLAECLQWSGGHPLSPDDANPDGLIAKPVATSTEIRGKQPSDPISRRLQRTYSKPFLAHGSIAPSCALARFEDGSLTVWTHTQGVFPLRGALASALHLDAHKINVIHMPGAGCYGHNGADDAACDAAIIACALPGSTVRVLWSRADELTAAPFGTPMVVTLEAETDASGKPRTWTSTIWSGPHMSRPGAWGGVNLLGAEQLPGQPPKAIPQEAPEHLGGSGTRNAWVPYDMPQQTLHNHLIVDLAPRTSSMRGLGAFANVFAIESFMDELAAESGADPVDFRLGLLTDPRAREVISKAAAMSGWRAGERRGDGRGRGIAYSRYKNRAGYLALIVDVRVEETVRLEKVWCAVDAGLVVNPDGVRNQVEGGIIQAASWTLKEQARFDDGRVTTRSWDTYPILRFSEVPEIEISLIERPDDNRPLGVGEVAQGPTAAAIANAVADALGVRLRDLPLTRERIIATL